MWELILERLPTKLGFACTLLAFLIPYTVYKVNNKLHMADPPWKKGAKKQPNEKSNPTP